MGNSTEVTEFILLGLTDDPKLHLPFFLVFLFIYLLTVVGNLGMMVLIHSDSRLHTPMYFFLSNLSFVDLGYSSAVAPKVAAALYSGNKVISYSECAAQSFFFAGFATVECYLLAVMAYDRHAAVCKPLHYTTTMTTSVCICLAIGSYVCGFVNSSIHTGDTFSLSFCSSNVVHHFFCDIPPLLALSCSDAHISELVVFFVVGFNVFFTLLVILISYLFIFIAILRMRSAEGRQKAFSTCASHLIGVSMFYGTIIFMYLQPGSSHSMDTDKIASVFYSVVIPMLNPLIYSLRNKEVKNALRKMIKQVRFSRNV
ncbi:olfactory receptor 1444-like [Trichosurus vulpecula]|uniref:olfactory receptor 1444-like n=1 Tax=Trichosurus vulpecula TaxID=9337 RepID=UPI00186B3BF4|nr:olfactory receptor 1444-like [Trichosurus vulpecula]